MLGKKLVEKLEMGVLEEKKHHMDNGRGTFCYHRQNEVGVARIYLDMQHRN